MATAITPLITFVIFNVSAFYITILNFIHLIGWFARFYFHHIAEKNNSIFELVVMLTATTTLHIGLNTLCAYLAFNIEKAERKKFVLNRSLESRMSKNREIMSILLPEFVKEKFLKGEKYTTEKQQFVTVLFCYILYFDEICEQYSPQELISLLDNIFIKFDQCCDQCGVTKIETVGNCYMACAGLKDSEEKMHPDLLKKNHAERCVDMAFSMIKKIQNQQLKNGISLCIKIGINSGKVIPGIVGKVKPQFALVGNTVNTSSRMCSTVKQPMKIRISGSTYKLVKNMSNVQFQYESVQAKGLGNVDTYLISEKQISDTKFEQQSNEKSININSTFTNQDVSELVTEPIPSPRNESESTTLLQKPASSKQNLSNLKSRKKSFISQLEVIDQTELIQNDNKRKFLYGCGITL